MFNALLNWFFDGFLGGQQRALPLAGPGHGERDREEIGEVKKRESELKVRLAQMEGRLKEADGRLREADGHAREGERRIREAERRAKEAEVRVTEAERRVKEVEGRVKEAEGRARDAERRFKAAEETSAALRNAQTKENNSLRSREQKTAIATRQLQSAHDALLKEKETWTKTREENAQLQQSHAQIKKDLTAAQETVKEKSREVEILRAAITDKDSLLQTRGSELREAQAYLSKTDSRSHAEVLGMVQRLNAQIFQLAASVADSFVYEGSSTSQTQLQTQRISVVNYIGEGLADLLLAMRYSGESACVQMALQACLCRFASRIIGAWDLSFQEMQNDVIQNIYLRIFKGEPSAICGKWKSLTRQYARELGEGQDTTSPCKGYILAEMSNILLVSGAATDAQDVSRAMEEQFGDKVVDIVMSSIAVQRAVGEDIVSSDFQITCPRFNENFVVEEMEDVNDDGRQPMSRGVSTKSTVLCATDIGLKRRENRNSGDPVGTSEVVAVTMLKSRVALSSLADELLEEYPQAY